MCVCAVSITYWDFMSQKIFKKAEKSTILLGIYTHVVCMFYLLQCNLHLFLTRDRFNAVAISSFKSYPLNPKQIQVCNKV